MNDIFKKVKSEIDYAETTRIKSNPSYVKNEFDRLDLIDKYMLSRYRDSDTDSFGQPMVFYNICSVPVEVASKMLNFSTKDIMLLDEIGSYWETWMMEKELRFWMKDKYFGRQLNEWSTRLPRDGHLVLKKTDDDVHIVPLKNLRLRVDANKLDETPIIEKHEYPYDQFVKEAKERGWSNWKKVKKIEDSTSAGILEKKGTKICLYEVWFPEGFLPNKKSNWFLLSYDGHILADMYSDIMYKDLAWENMDNRLFGRGQVEKLFNEQIYLNRIANYKAEGLHWSSKRLFQTRDPNANSNLMGQAENGDVFIVNNPLTQVPVEERNLSFYGYDEDRTERQSIKRTFTQDSVTGERPPSGTPLGSSVLQAQMTAGFYERKKEELAMFVKEVLWDWIIPEFKKEKRKEHKVLVRSLMSTEEGSEKFFKMQVNKEMNKELVKGYMPPEIREIKRALISEKIKDKKLTIPKGLYDNLKYKMEINIVGESIDTSSKLTTLQTLFQIIGSNPTVLQDKATKNILFKMLNLAGFNPKEFNFEEEPSTGLAEAGMRAKAMRGGSVAAPQSPPTTPEIMPTQKTL